MKKKLLVIVGTRPEAIKMAPVVLAAQAIPDLECKLCLTAQHRDLLDQVLAAFGLKADFDLNLMKPGQTLAGLTARAVEALDAVFAAERPDLALIQGDTTTVLCAALAAFYQHVPFGHVEAGLRTGDLLAPWPEEANRVLASRLAALHFAPTQRSRQNLLREGIVDERIAVTGNTGIDALFHMRGRLVADSTLGQVPWLDARRKLVLITSHRRENFGAPFEEMCQAIADLAGRFADHDFVYPVHPNPNVQAPVHAILGNVADPRLAAGNVRLIAPLGYTEFVRAMDACTLILTDSGGVQEEAPSLGKPVLVLREVTERPEAVDAGTVRIVGTDRAKIVREATRLLTDAEAYAAMGRAHNPYGDGKAAERILNRCVAFLGGAAGSNA
jgi:UDP-N-acetylglucosamine 2-epimerase (non-hydrolysing)